jgi:hypothetical protein
MPGSGSSDGKPVYVWGRSPAAVHSASATPNQESPATTAPDGSEGAPKRRWRAKPAAVAPGKPTARRGPLHRGKGAVPVGREAQEQAPEPGQRQARDRDRQERSDREVGVRRVRPDADEDQSGDEDEEAPAAHPAEGALLDGVEPTDAQEGRRHRQRQVDVEVVDRPVDEEGDDAGHREADSGDEEPDDTEPDPDGARQREITHRHPPR